MSIFKQDREIKRMIFNIYADTADRLESLKTEARHFDKRLDVDSAVNESLGKFVAKAEKKLVDLKHEAKGRRHAPHSDAARAAGDDSVQDGGQESTNEKPTSAA
jgi:hypothetical protein